MQLDRTPPYSSLLLLKTLCEKRNLAAAAEVLGLSASSASRHLSEMRELFDDKLFTRFPGGLVPTRRALEIAAQSEPILDGYAEERGMQLQITERSMATELLIHAYLDGLFDRWGRAGNAHGRQNGRLYKMAKRLKNATAVIDMGERSVDTNRWVFDLLAPVYRMLCVLLGSRA